MGFRVYRPLNGVLLYKLLFSKRHPFPNEGMRNDNGRMAAQTTLILHHWYRYEQREPKEVRDAAQITGNVDVVETRGCLIGGESAA